MSDRGPRYELVPEEEDSPATPVSVSTVVIVEEETELELPTVNTPLVAATEQTQNEVEDSDNRIAVPPSYSVATNLPSYEEAERSKAEEEARRDQEQPEQDSGSSSFFDAVTPMLMRRSTQRNTATESDSQLGTDGTFMCTFLFAFLFNWIGLLGSLCITQTIAGRLGAMSGFGLSLVKWVAFVKHVGWADGLQGDSWLWWLLIIMGFLIFLRGCTQYIRIKFYWSQLSQNVRNNIFYYF